MCKHICKNCVWFADLKHNFEVGKGYEHSHCCLAFGGEGMIIQVKTEDTCEEFFERIDASELIREYK